jgi:hypothetical protein
VSSPSFWERQLGVPSNDPQRPAQAPQRAWWQDSDPRRQEPAPGYQPQPTNYGGLQQQMPYGGPTAGAGVPEAQYIQQLRTTPASQLSGEQMEQIAEFELRTKQSQLHAGRHAGRRRHHADREVLQLRAVGSRS